MKVAREAGRLRRGESVTPSPGTLLVLTSTPNERGVPSKRLPKSSVTVNKPLATSTPFVLMLQVVSPPTGAAASSKKIQFKMEIVKAVGRLATRLQATLASEGRAVGMAG